MPRGTKQMYVCVGFDGPFYSLVVTDGVVYACSRSLRKQVAYGGRGFRPKQEETLHCG